MFKKAILCLGLLVGCASNDTNSNTDAVNIPSGKDITASNYQYYSHSNIVYHGGPVLLGTVNVYTIWYGNWSSNTATTILPDFITHLFGSPWFDINTTYYNANKQYVGGLVSLAGSTNDNYSRGNVLSDADVQTVVANAINNHSLPLDNNGVYFVLTSSDVNESSGFCTQYCGWHFNGNVSGADIKYAFVGNPDRCPSACEAQTTSPNNNAGADGMASIIAHELSEATTDPDLNAWYFRNGNENADACAWHFGSVFKVANGSYANVFLGDRYYLVQENWANINGGYCTLHL